ncbi:MAG TPA: hypothetical protein VE860_09370, partial [Chthoniobacterales bacterium]|nr:hypothetical protein [Chthoniobacterales bacterium]
MSPTVSHRSDTDQLALIYGKGKDGATPVRDKSQLVESLQIGAFERVERIGKAVNALISPEPIRKEFLAHEKVVRTLFQAVKPDPATTEFVSGVSCLGTIADEIRMRTCAVRSGDISGVLADVNRLLDDSIAADGFRIAEAATGQQQ